MTVLDTSIPLPTQDSGYQLELGDAERSRLQSLAQQLSDMPPGLVDHPEWIEHARHLSCHLPIRLLQAIRRYRHDSGVGGTLFLSGLPIDEDALPDTPSVPESVERVAAVPSAVAMLIGVQLGEVVAYREEKGGALVQNVVPVRGFERSQSNAGATELAFHVENAFHPCRPDYVGLMCLRSDHEKTAGTLISSIRRARELLDADDLAVLQEPRFRTAAPPSFRSGESMPAHPVLQGSPDDPNICVDFNATTALDEAAGQSLLALSRALLQASTSLALHSGEMAFLDNRVVLHGRSSFTPRYDGRDRWLHRVYVHLDNRRSRPLRSSNGAVLA